MFNSTPAEFIATAITLVIAFTIHEFAHAWAATELGDDTARSMGRLTLNPLAHLDPIGSLMLIFAGFGWAKPVPFNPYRLRTGPQLGMLLVAAAGPFSNFIMALLAAIPFRLGWLPLSFGGDGFLPSPSLLLIWFIIINLNLMLFNLIPIPPLDGSKILRGVAPASWDRALTQLEMIGPFLLMALFVLGRFGGESIISFVIGPPMRFFLNTLLG